MKRDLCILITGEFPYITSEPFLESEIIYLSQAFEKIIIFALDAQNSNPITRPIPSNVIAVPVGYTQGKAKYIKYVAKGISKENKTYPVQGDNFYRKLYSIYEKGKAFEAFDFIVNYIETKRIRTDNCAIYSYWLSDHAFVAMLLKKKYSSSKSNIFAVARAHAFDLYTERHKIGFRPYQETKLAELDLVCPCSDDGRAYLLEKYPQYKNKVKTERLGTVDHGITAYKNDGWVLLTCCNLKKLKRISLFAKAFCLVAQKHKNVRWICIGNGEEFEDIKKIVHEGLVEDRVEFLGRKKNSEVIDYYIKNSVSYFCNVSILEGVPVAIMEAMSFGIPVIATNVGGTGELVTNKTGALIPRDIDEIFLAETILNEMNSDKNSHMEKRRKSREVWERLSSAEINYRNWSTFLSER